MDRNEYDLNLLLFVVRYGELPSLGMSARWRRERKRARWRSAVIVLYDGALCLDRQNVWIGQRKTEKKRKEI